MSDTRVDKTILLEARNLECVRAEQSLFSGLGFSLHRGQAIQVQGQNGAGKTSLLRILCGLSRPEQGEVLWRGKDIYGVREEFHHELVYIGHKSAVKADLTAAENITPAPSALLEKVGLTGYENTLCRYLSAGQQRRVALARLLEARESIWLLDEPLNAIDASGIEQFEFLFDRHLASGGGLVFTSHQALNLKAPVTGLSLV